MPTLAHFLLQINPHLLKICYNIYMSVFTPIGILLFGSLIVAFSGLTSGVFLILYHSLLGRMSRRRASDFAMFFIFGVETTLTLLLLSVYTIFNVSLGFINFYNSNIFTWILTGLLVFFGILYGTIYFRPSRGTKLFISRPIAHRYHVKAGTVKSRSDAFMLGLSALLPDLLFTTPILIISVLTVAHLGSTPPARAGLLILFVLISILPLLLLHLCFNSGRNLAELLRFRFKNKAFFRFLVTLFYFLVALLIILRNIL